MGQPLAQGGSAARVAGGDVAQRASARAAMLRTITTRIAAGYLAIAW